MKKSTYSKFALACGLLCIIIILFSYGIRQTYNQIESEMLTLFEKAIRLDQEKRSLYPIISFTDEDEYINGNDSVMVIQDEETGEQIKKADFYKKKSMADRAYIIIHLFLADMNPIHPQALDSLYNSLLQQEHIPAQTAISYEYEGHTSYSSQDTTFYTSAHVLPQVFIGINEEYGLTLQAFVKLPKWYIGKDFFHKYRNILVVSLIISLLLFYFIYLTYKKRNTILTLSNPPRELIQLAEGLLFDETHGILIYKGKEITLTNYKMKLFQLLIQNKGIYLTSDFICQSLWPEGMSTKNALTQTVKRLRAELEPIPFISIQSARNKGYCLMMGEI